VTQNAKHSETRPQPDRFCYTKPEQIEWVQKSPAMLAEEKHQAVHRRAAKRRSTRDKTSQSTS
jgi:hypothetical protein